MELVKIYRETLPEVRLTGKRYTDEDRDASGTFSLFWQQCFDQNWPDTLMQGKTIAGVSEDLVGAIRITGADGAFEYWIGAFLAPDSKTPDGFESVLIPASELAVCWLYGNEESGELFGMESSERAMAAFAERDWPVSGNGWFFERYNCPRFTKPDEKGNVILDICACLAQESVTD